MHPVTQLDIRTTAEDIATIVHGMTAMLRHMATMCADGHQKSALITLAAASELLDDKANIIMEMAA